MILGWNEYLKTIEHLPWQYVLDEARSGQENMDRDAAFLEQAEMPLLRLYAWSRPTLSLGYGQHDDWIDRPLCQELGVDIVRRPTGGRALLHLPDEITYAVVLPKVGDLSIKAAFTGITSILSEALRKLGVPCSSAADSHVPTGALHPSCLEVTAPGEITALGMKLVGSAQVRRFNNLLQHGAIPRCSNAELLAKVIPGAHPQCDLAMTGFADLEASRLMEAWKEAVAEAMARI